MVVVSPLYPQTAGGFVSLAAPSTSHISFTFPDTAIAGGNAFTLSVSGSGFAAGAVVSWNGTLLTTTFVSSGSLTADVPASLIAAVGSPSIVVTNPGVGPSNAVSFSIVITPAVPNLTSGNISYTWDTATGLLAGKSLTLQGTGLQQGMTVSWNTTNLGPVDGSLAVAVPLSLVRTPGPVSIVATNPGGAPSSALNLTVPSLRTLTSITPATVPAGSGSFILTVNGSGFAAGDTISVWPGGFGLAAQFINSTQLQTTVPASFVTANATLQIWVSTFTASGSFSSTNELPLTVGTGLPVLSIAKTHTGNFAQGQQNALYTATVSNASSVTTSGTVTVTESVPAGLTLASMSGTGWTCGGNSCSRSDAVAGGASYPPITIAVNVSFAAPAVVINSVGVSGGGSLSGSGSDPTTIAAVGGAPDVITSPASGSLLSDPPVTFCWTNNGNYVHWLDVGTAPGLGDLYGWAQAAGDTCKTITDPGSMLGNGGTVYVTVRSLINGAWNPPPGSLGSGGTSATYTAPLHTFWPLDNTVFTSSSVTFSWAPVPGANRYWLDVGPSQGNGSIFGGYVNGTSQLVTNIIPTGIPIWVRLWVDYGAGLQLNSDHRYTACDRCVGTITSPQSTAGYLPGSMLGSLPGSSVTFSWNTALSADAYFLDVGTMPGQGDIYGVNQGLGTSQTVSGLPTTGLLYVQLTTHTNGDWKRPAMQYRFLGYDSTGRVYSPTPGSALPSSTVTFNWTAGIGAQGYWLDVGTVQGQGNIYAGYQGTATSRTVTGIPSGKIWVRLWTYYNGLMVPLDYQYPQ